ncbi:hypothetical protein CTAYLR_005082 [Chrysophaeum taylorii]|uniref:Uncharacterized protein n=1 Tax=Chrysophaeum taylorii TaxID=2483200 RepID=A0AAD7XJS6_9STRA|nr:hypothetical protein CTAYLR_005082 [Chrysophaeum taylorii]
MRVALDVINRFLWDPEVEAGRCVVGYRDRILNTIVEKPLSAFSSWGRIEQAAMDALAVPQHRIVYFKFDDAVVWDKRTRLDRVFGSTPPFERCDLSGCGNTIGRPTTLGEVGTPLQRYLRERGVEAFSDVRPVLLGLRCKVATKTLGKVKAYSAMYADATQFAPQTTTTTADLAHLALDHCRGCVYEQDTNRLLCAAFDKFWEVEDHRAADVAVDDDAVVTEKCDGLLTKVYFVDGRWRVASNGCIDAFDARFRWGDEIDDDDADCVSVGSLFVEAANATSGGFDKLCEALRQDRCYAFELLHPRARVIAPHVAPRLVHLLTRALPGGEEVEEDLDGDVVARARVLSPNAYAVMPGTTRLARLLQFTRRLPAYREGFVARDARGRRIKIKSRAYLAAHGARDRTVNRGFFELSSLLETDDDDYDQAFPPLLVSRDAARVEAFLPKALATLAHENGMSTEDIRDEVCDVDSQTRLDLENLVARYLASAEDTRVDEVCDVDSQTRLDHLENPVARDLASSSPSSHQEGREPTVVVAPRGESDSSSRNKTVVYKKDIKDPRRPNLFLAIKVDAPAIVSRVRALQDALVHFEPRLDSALQPTSSLHVTLATARVDGELERRRLDQVLRDEVPALLGRHMFAGNRPVVLSLEGVHSFSVRGQVVYVAPKERGRLNALSNDLYDSLEQAGFNTAGRRATTRAHVTVAKLPRQLARSLGYFDETAWRRSGFGPDTIFGVQEVDGVHLCVAGLNGGAAPSGFYRTLATYYPALAEMTTTLKNQVATFDAIDDAARALIDDVVSTGALDDAKSTSFVVILRGVPGSGKTTMARKLGALAAEASVSCEACSADAYFGAKNGGFSAAKLDTAHGACRGAAAKAIQARVGIVVIDNTNCGLREMAPYVDLAAKHGASLGVVEFACASLEDARRLASRGEHGVNADSAWCRWEALPATTTDATRVVVVVVDGARDQAAAALDALASRRQIAYAGVVLSEASRQQLVRAYPPRSAVVRAHHATVAFRPAAGSAQARATAQNLGRGVSLAVGPASADANAHAVSCVALASESSFPHDGWRGHITIAHATNFRPADSRALDFSSFETAPREKGVTTTVRGRLGVQLVSGEVITTSTALIEYALLSSSKPNKKTTPARVVVDFAAPRSREWKSATNAYVWDFDGTLLETAPCGGASLPSPDDPTSLAPDRPCAPLLALARLHDLARRDSSAVHVLLTGRVAACASAVRRLLRRYRADALFDAFCFKPDAGSTADFKARTVEKIVATLPRLADLCHYDDDAASREAVAATVAIVCEDVAFRSVDPRTLHSDAPPLQQWLACFGRGRRPESETAAGRDAIALVDARYKQIVATGRCEAVGSWPRGRRSDVDLVCVGSSCASSRDALALLERLATLLRDEGSAYLGRSPRRPVLSLTTRAGVEVDVSVALVGEESARPVAEDVDSVCALDALDIALRARGIGGAPWLHAMRTHELSSALDSFGERATPGALAAAFSSAVADGSVPPPGKIGRVAARAWRVRAAFREIADLMTPSWPRDARILDILSRAAPFPPEAAVALVRSSSGQGVETRELKARLSSACARLFHADEIALYPAPPELTDSSFSFAVCGPLSPDRIASLMREPVALVTPLSRGK